MTKRMHAKHILKHKLLYGREGQGEGGAGNSKRASRFELKQEKARVKLEYQKFELFFACELPGHSV